MRFIVVSYCGGDVWGGCSLSVALNQHGRWLYGITFGSGGYMASEWWHRSLCGISETGDCPSVRIT